MIREILIKIRNFFLTEVGKSTAMVIIFILIAIIIQTVSYSFIKGSTKEISMYLGKADMELNYTSDIKKTDNKKENIILSQIKATTELKQFFYYTGLLYFRNYYAFVICSIVFITLASIGAFLLAHKGWANASLILKIYVISNAALSSIYYFLPTVMSNKVNYTENFKKVKNYAEVQNKILSFYSNFEKRTPQQIDSFIENTYSTISKDFDFIISIDDSKLGNNALEALKSQGN